MGQPRRTQETQGSALWNVNDTGSPHGMEVMRIRLHGHKGQRFFLVGRRYADLLHGLERAWMYLATTTIEQRICLAEQKEH